MSSTWKRPSGNDVPTNTDFWKSENQNGRQAAGQMNAKADNLSADPGYGKLRARGTSGKSDPLGQTKGKAHASNDGKVGATYRIVARMPAQMQQNAAVQANGRILKPTHGRSDSFYAQGISDSATP